MLYDARKHESRRDGRLEPDYFDRTKLGSFKFRHMEMLSGIPHPFLRDLS